MIRCGTRGTRDENLLDSALNAPFQGYGEYEFYPSVVQKAVRLCYGLVMNHPFHDGNKKDWRHGAPDNLGSQSSNP